MKCTFINSKNERISFENMDCDTPYILRQVESENPVLLYSNKGVLQHGSRYINNSLDNRDITLHVSLNAKSQYEIESLKNKLYKVFNPSLGLGELIYKNKKIKCIVNEIPFFSSNNDEYVECIINLTAFTPFWTDISLNKKEIALWRGAFHFPLIIPKDKGIIMGYREPSLIVNINNKGQADTGMIIKFKSKGRVTNPSLLNINTREYIKINTTLEAGESITINTNYGEKSITKEGNGLKENVLNYLDIGGGDDFLQLHVGDNLFRYDSDSGLEYLEVDLFYYQKYLGV